MYLSFSTTNDEFKLSDKRQTEAIQKNKKNILCLGFGVKFTQQLTTK